MYTVDRPQGHTKEFVDCLAAAVRHLDGLLSEVGVNVQDLPPVGDPGFAEAAARKRGIRYSWIKFVPRFGPCLDHLSFILGNQAFFVRMEDADGRVEFPGDRKGLERVADGWLGYSCIMPMRRVKDASGATDDAEEDWRPVLPDWGLVGPSTGIAVRPPALLVNDPVPATDWELHDFAVNIVGEHLMQMRQKVVAWNTDPATNPSIWFEGGGQPSWVIVRAYRAPAKSAERPSPDLVWRIRKETPVKAKGYFTEVGFESMDGGQPLRGEPYNVDFAERLIPLD